MSKQHKSTITGSTHGFAINCGEQWVSPGGKNYNRWICDPRMCHFIDEDTGDYGCISSQHFWPACAIHRSDFNKDVSTKPTHARDLFFVEGPNMAGWKLLGPSTSELVWINWNEKKCRSYVKWDWNIPSHQHQNWQATSICDDVFACHSQPVS